MSSLGIRGVRHVDPVLRQDEELQASITALGFHGDHGDLHQVALQADEGDGLQVDLGLLLQLLVLVVVVWPEAATLDKQDMRWPWPLLVATT